MKDKFQQLEKNLVKIEKQLHFHGHWGTPDEEVPQIEITLQLSPEISQLASLLNRIMKIRCLPVLSNLVGAANESLVDSFLYDCETPIDRVDLVQREYNLLVEYLDLIPEFDVIEFREEE